MIEYDEFGPEKILSVYDANTAMRGIVVIDSTTLGPGKGGIRMTSTLDKEEVAKLARNMTWKCALTLARSRVSSGNRQNGPFSN